MLLSPTGFVHGRAIEWAWLGRLPYARALALQERVHADVVAGRAPETLLLLEHDPVITLGRHADPAHVLAGAEALGRDGIIVFRTSRGGDVTYHGPGQLVGYPIFRLPRGIKAHVTAMAGAVVAVLADLGITAAWRPAQPGVWVGDDKICAVGVQVRRRVTLHGFALNVNVDLAGFGHIVPCGLPSAGVTSIGGLHRCAPALPALAERLAGAFARSFATDRVRIPAASSRLQIADEDL
jgi:lipoyl(octanoyl) transferase